MESLLVILLLKLCCCVMAVDPVNKIADKPLFRDPLYDDAADPTVIWNSKENKWFMFYTNRRANSGLTGGVEGVHGTRIGIAESTGGGATWRMYYNNEVDGKSIYYADSPDLYRWTDSGKKAVGDKAGEGPNVFGWKGKYWMVVDNWNGCGIYSSGDMVNWDRQEKNILQEPGKGPDDGVIGAHPCVIISSDRAFIFYFTHPGRIPGNRQADPYQNRRSSIQVAEMEFRDGQIVCDRDKPMDITMKPGVDLKA